MPAKYPWFEFDKESLCEYVAAIGLTIEIGPVSEGNYGEYVGDRNLIRLGDEVVLQPKHLITTILHELGHHFETFLPRHHLRPGFEDNLLSEYLAGAVGLVILHSLQLEIPVSYYIDFNASNIRNFWSWRPKTAQTPRGQAVIKRRVLVAYDSQVDKLKDHFGCALSLTETRVVLS